MSAAPVAQSPARVTWTAKAKKRDQPLGSIAWADDGGSPKTLDLRQTGYLQELRLVVTAKGQYATAGPTAVDLINQYCGPVSRITVRTGGVATFFDCSGFMAAAIWWVEANYRKGSAIPFNTRPYNFVSSPALAAYTDQWSYTIPIGIYLRTFDAPVGLFQTAVQGQETQIEVRYTNQAAATTAAPGSSLYLGNQANAQAAAYAGSTMSINQVYFDPIVERQAQPNLSIIHQWRDWTVPLTADGDTEIRLPAGNIYLRILLLAVHGAAGALAPSSTIITRIRLTYGANITPYDWTYDQIQSIMATQFGNATIPAGLFVIDWINETHDERDAFNSAAATDIRLIITTSGGTYTGGAYVRVAVEQLIPLGSAVPGSIGPQGMN